MSKKCIKEGRDVSIPTNQDPANILGRYIGAWRAKREIVSFRVVRACGAYVRSDPGEKVRVVTFPFPFLDREVFPFPSALQGPIQLQLALSVIFAETQ